MKLHLPFLLKKSVIASLAAVAASSCSGVLTGGLFLVCIAGQAMAATTSGLSTNENDPTTLTTDATDTCYTVTDTNGYLAVTEGRVQIHSLGDTAGDKNTITKLGDGTLVVNNRGDKPGLNLVVEEGKVEVLHASNNNNGFITGTVSVKAGAELSLTNTTTTDALGWGGGGSSVGAITLTGEESSYATLSMAQKNTLHSALTLNGYTRVSAVEGATDTGLELTGGSITANGADNEIGVALLSRKSTTVTVNENSTLKLTAGIRTASWLDSTGATGVLNKQGAGELIIAAKSSMMTTPATEGTPGNYTGVINVNQGKLTFDHNGDSSTIGGLTVAAGATVRIENGSALTLKSDSTINGTLELKNQLTLEDSATLTFASGAVVDVTGLVSFGDNDTVDTSIVTADSAVSGLTAGMVKYDTGDASFVLASITNAATGTFTLTKVDTEDTLTIDTEQELHLIRAHTVDSVTIKNGGTLLLGNGAYNSRELTATSGINIEGGGTLVMSNNAVRSGNITGTGKLRLEVQGTSAYGLWSGHKSIFSSFAGDFELGAGPLEIADDDALGSAKSITISGGTMKLTGAIEWNKGLTISGGTVWLGNAKGASNALGVGDVTLNGGKLVLWHDKANVTRDASSTLANLTMAAGSTLHIEDTENKGGISWGSLILTGDATISYNWAGGVNFKKLTGNGNISIENAASQVGGKNAPASATCERNTVIDTLENYHGTITDNMSTYPSDGQQLKSGQNLYLNAANQADGKNAVINSTSQSQEGFVMNGADTGSVQFKNHTANGDVTVNGGTLTIAELLTATDHHVAVNEGGTLKLQADARLGANTLTVATGATFEVHSTEAQDLAALVLEADATLKLNNALNFSLNAATSTAKTELTFGSPVETGIMLTDASQASYVKIDVSGWDDKAGLLAGTDALFTGVASNTWTADAAPSVYLDFGSDNEYATNSGAYTLKLENNSVFVSSNADAIPEPTTATLSLLALAALTARRRRK